MDLIATITVFILAVFVGVEVISKVPPTLHTPLMSATNAIHGVILVGAILVLATARSAPLIILGFVAVVFGTLNVVGGFVVTDRMLEMFKRKPKHPKSPEETLPGKSPLILDERPGGPE